MMEQLEEAESKRHQETENKRHQEMKIARMQQQINDMKEKLNQVQYVRSETIQPK